MTSENQQQQQLQQQQQQQQGQQNGHASPEIHLRGAEQQQQQQPRPEGEDDARRESLADDSHEMDHVQDAISKAEDPKELDGLMEVGRNGTVIENTLMRTRTLEGKNGASSKHFRRSGRG